jgi:hypothetical protein
MKKILVILFALVAFTVSANAQSTSTRQTVFGVTDASLSNFHVATFTDTLGSTIDTNDISPRAYTNQYNETVVDSAVLRCKSLTQCYKGDRLNLYVTGPAQSGVLVLLSTQFVVASGTNRIALTANKKGFISFVFDGTKWIEVDRNFNY